MKYSLLLLAVLALPACKKSVSQKTSTGNINIEAPYMWAVKAFPRDLKISDDFTNDEVANIQDMTNAWESAIGNKIDFFKNNKRTPEVSKKNLDLDALGDDDINGVYKITSWPKELNSGALAVTQIFGRRFNVGDGDEYVRIEHADILLNENLYSFRTGDGGPAGTFDLQTVILHELGHFLGLNHKYGNTVMIPSIDPDSVSRTPTSIDKTDLVEKYEIAGAGHAISGGKKRYVPRDKGQKVKIMIELMASGECVHKENGVETQRHSLSIR